MTCPTVEIIRDELQTCPINCNKIGDFPDVCAKLILLFNR